MWTIKEYTCETLPLAFEMQITELSRLSQLIYRLELLARRYKISSKWALYFASSRVAAIHNKSYSRKRKVIYILKTAAQFC